MVAVVAVAAAVCACVRHLLLRGVIIDLVESEGLRGLARSACVVQDPLPHHKHAW